jgi:hypothetical protein
MIRLKPDPENRYTCPQCQASSSHVNDFVLDSVNVFACCECLICSLKFDQVLPVGHTVDHSLSYGAENLIEYKNSDCPEWLWNSVFKSHKNVKTEEVAIERIIYKQCNKVVILNTLDSLYGHVLLKLYNAFHHLDTEKEIGLIIIIPKIFKWLIPQGCAEVWIVDLKLSDMIYGYSSLQKFVSEQFQRFDTIYLSNAFSHPMVNSSDAKRLTGIEPFNLNGFSKQKPVITFILREDRWWFYSPVDYWFYRICRKLNISAWGGRVLTHRQNKLVKKTSSALKKQLPDVQINLVGLGEKGQTASGVSDYRTVKVNEEVEREWCHIYAKSHVVIGIHGSNMLLPTALAAGCVEILPEDRYGNMVQDISVRYTDRQQLFFYRFAEQYSTPQSIANKAIAIIKDYPIFKKNMITNCYNRPS